LAAFIEDRRSIDRFDGEIAMKAAVAIAA